VGTFEGRVPRGHYSCSISVSRQGRSLLIPAESIADSMKLVIAVIHNRDKGRVVDALLERQFEA
jgi:hypothetical protein